MLASFMKLFKQLGFLRVALPANARAAHKDDRVVDLFRNRAELKKAYSATQEELLQLKDRIKQQEGATSRVQEMLQGLEARLASPVTAYQAIVFYQLRELWTLGRTLLDQFVTDLATQREEHERRQFLAEYNRSQFARRQTVEATLRHCEAAAFEARAEVARLEQQLAGFNRWWHYFKRRLLRTQLQPANMKSLLAGQDFDAARQAHESLLAEPEPAFPGISVQARRAINLAAIAYAQVLCERLATTQLLEPARDASSRREPPEESYGDRARCEALIADIQRARLVMQQNISLQQELRVRVEAYKAAARYRGDDDTMPAAESLVSAVGGAGTQVLVDDSWEVHRLLLR
jgi:hypothetical protein